MVSAVESILSPHGYEMSKKLNIDNPDKNWTKEWLELDADQDGYFSNEPVVVNRYKIDSNSSIKFSRFSFITVFTGSKNLRLSTNTLCCSSIQNTEEKISRLSKKSSSI
jgi:hypothetical protein